MRVLRSAIVFLILISAVSCVYPRRGTSVSLVRHPRETLHPPANVWKFTLRSAHLPRRMRGDLLWDGPNDGPDVFVRIYRGGELVWESEVIDNEHNPEWDIVLPRNVYLPPHTEIRFEVWDQDAVGNGDPVGIYRHIGLPDNVVPGNEARVMLDTGATLRVRIDDPVAHRGVGIEQYEVQPDALRVLSVLPYSPAGRAEIQAEDMIISVGDRRISDLRDAQAASALSMAANRRDGITLLRDGRERRVELDHSYVWLTM